MLEKHNDFQVGNWVVYLPEGNYCTIQSLSPGIELEGALQSYSCTIECIEKIKITHDKLQVCGFEVDYPWFWKISTSKILVAIIMSSSGIHDLYKNEEKFCRVQYIHEVQNAYYKITGEFIRGNLYGVQDR